MNTRRRILAQEVENLETIEITDSKEWIVKCQPWGGKTSFQLLSGGTVTSLIIDDVAQSTGMNANSIPITNGNHTVRAKVSGTSGNNITLFYGGGEWGIYYLRIPDVDFKDFAVISYLYANITLEICRTTPPLASSNYFPPASKIRVVKVPKGCGAAYKAATGWKNYADKIVEVNYKYITSK